MKPLLMEVDGVLREVSGDTWGIKITECDHGIELRDNTNQKEKIRKGKVLKILQL